MQKPYKELDQSSLVMYLFHPRLQHSDPPRGARDLHVPVAKEVSLVCRVYPSVEWAPWILYFHGNGEVASDYDMLAHHYTERRLNLLVADYRGYGASGGSPSFHHLAADAALVFDYVREQLDPDHVCPWFVMGRSLGSIPALELASSRADALSGLIVESGFLSAAALVEDLGIPFHGDLTPVEEYARNLSSSIQLPALVVHGDRDSLVSPERGRELHAALPGARGSGPLFISGADHNNIFFVDTARYMETLSDFVSGVSSPG